MRSVFYDIDGNPIDINVLPELPAWLSDVLPEPEAPLLIDLGTEPDSVRLIFPDGTVSEFTSLGEALPTIDESELRTEFSDALLERESKRDKSFARSIFVDTGNSHNSRIIVEDHDAGEVLDLRESYYISLQAIERFLANPTDYLLAWDFVNKHPAFWMNHYIDRFPYHWETDNGTHQMSQYVYSENGKTMIRLEIGGHIGPEYKHTYGDYRLHPCATTHEEAFLKLASRIYLVFNNDGTDREAPDALSTIIEDLKGNLARFGEYNE